MNNPYLMQLSEPRMQIKFTFLGLPAAVRLSNDASKPLETQGNTTSVRITWEKKYLSRHRRLMQVSIVMAAICNIHEM